MTELARCATREQAPEPDLGTTPTLRPFAVDHHDDTPYWVCAPSLRAARRYVADRRRSKGLSAELPPIVPLPMYPLRGEE